MLNSDILGISLCLVMSIGARSIYLWPLQLMPGILPPSKHNSMTLKIVGWVVIQRTDIKRMET